MRFWVGPFSSARYEGYGCVPLSTCLWLWGRSSITCCDLKLVSSTDELLFVCRMEMKMKQTGIRMRSRRGPLVLPTSGETWSRA